MSDIATTKTLIIGLSGPSSSGKTTLARLLRGAFNTTNTNSISIKLFILHEDDFYKTDAEIPVITATSQDHGRRSLQDWDCVESLDLALLARTIRHVKTHGRLPDDMFSKEDQNSVGDVGVSNAEIDGLNSRVASWLDALDVKSVWQVTVCVLDGFLLFPSPLEGGLMMELRGVMGEMLDLKVFLPSTRTRTLERRARRSGYVTLEGFWEDPPGYVEDVVWPNYARDHGWMFAGVGDVDEGRVDRESELVRKEGIVVGPGSGEVGMREMLNWGVELVKDLIADAVSGERI